MKKIALFPLICLLTFFTSIIYSQGNTDCIVTADPEAVVRGQPSLDAPAGTFSGNALVHAQLTDEGGTLWWYSEILPGWILADAVTASENCADVPPYSQDYLDDRYQREVAAFIKPILHNFPNFGADASCEVSGNNANIRQEAATSSTIIGNLNEPQIAFVMSIGDDGLGWFALQNGGFVREDVVTFNEACDTLTSLQDIHVGIVQLAPDFIPETQFDAPCEAQSDNPVAIYNAPIIGTDPPYSSGEQLQQRVVSQLVDFNGIRWLLLQGLRVSNQWVQTNAVSLAGECDNLPIFPEVIAITPTTDLLAPPPLDFSTAVVVTGAPARADLTLADYETVVPRQGKALDYLLGYELSRLVSANLESLRAGNIIAVDARGFFDNFVAHEELNLLNRETDDRTFQSDVYVAEIFISRQRYNSVQDAGEQQLFYSDGLQMFLLPDLAKDQLSAIEVLILHQRPPETSAYDGSNYGFGYIRTQLRFEQRDENVYRGVFMGRLNINDFNRQMTEIRAIVGGEDGLGLEYRFTTVDNMLNFAENFEGMDYFEPPVDNDFVTKDIVISDIQVLVTE